jgi:hypothetical protein
VVTAIVEFFARLLEASKDLPGVRRDQKRKAILIAMLSEHFEWRRLATLARAVGASDEKTRELLISINARASTTGGDEAWGLIARVSATGTGQMDPLGQTDDR